MNAAESNMESTTFRDRYAGQERQWCFAFAVDQMVKETCTFCNIRTGYDYWIICTVPYKKEAQRK